MAILSLISGARTRFMCNKSHFKIYTR